MQINHLRICAFRYALGRMTYVVQDVVEELLDHWDEFDAVDKEQIVSDINIAILAGAAGMDCDVRQWQRVLDRAGLEVHR